MLHRLQLSFSFHSLCNLAISLLIKNPIGKVYPTTLLNIPIKKIKKTTLLINLLIFQLKGITFRKSIPDFYIIIFYFTDTYIFFIM